MRTILRLNSTQCIPLFKSFTGLGNRLSAAFCLENVSARTSPGSLTSIRLNSHSSACWVLDWRSRCSAPKTKCIPKCLTTLLPPFPELTHFRNLCTVSDMESICPPPSVRGMKKLDRAAFSTSVKVPILRVPNVKLHQIVALLKKSLFKKRGLSNINDLEEGDDSYKKFKLFTLDPAKCQKLEDLPNDAIEWLKNQGVTSTDVSFVDIELKYENWAYDEILDAVLPADSDKVGGFTKIGHILHLNLKDNLLDYKNLIGEVLLDKISDVRTVVNKTNIIDNTYRNFSMEILAGEENMITTAKENGFLFEMDFSKVFWNSRLGTEHQRIIDLLREGDVVYDVMAGVGPFAIPAAKKKCQVLANDLNPESYKWLKHNMQLNKVKVKTQEFNMDGRDFVRQIMKPHMMKIWCEAKERNLRMHVLMNLPALAVEFLDVFRGLCSERDLSAPFVTFPVVHCYSFCQGLTWGEEMKKAMIEKAEFHLGCPLPNNFSVRPVRNVAPGKEMLCLSFTLNRDILLKPKDTDADEPEHKRAKLE